MTLQSIYSDARARPRAFSFPPLDYHHPPALSCLCSHFIYLSSVLCDELDDLANGNCLSLVTLWRGLAIETPRLLDHAVTVDLPV